MNEEASVQTHLSWGWESAETQLYYKIHDGLTVFKVIFKSSQDRTLKGTTQLTAVLSKSTMKKRAPFKVTKPEGTCEI